MKVIIPKLGTACFLLVFGWLSSSCNFKPSLRYDDATPEGESLDAEGNEAPVVEVAENPIPSDSATASEQLGPIEEGIGEDIVGDKPSEGEGTPNEGDASDSLTETGPSFSELKAFLDDRVQTGAINGYAFQIFDGDDRLLLEAEAGICSSQVSSCPEGDQPFTSELVTGIASSSKWVTSTVILAVLDELVQNNSVVSVAEGLDRSVESVLGNTCSANPTGRGGQVTLRQLLAFTSGLLPDNACVDSRSVSTQQCACQILWDSAQVEVNDPLAGRASQTAHPPGLTYKYGPAHHVVAAAMVEVATGESFESLFTRKIKDPIGFEGAYLRPNNIAGSMRTNLSNYIKFVRAVFHDGKDGGEQSLLSKQAIIEQESAQTDENTVFRISPRGGFNYGLNIWRQCFKKYDVEQLSTLTPETYEAMIDATCTDVVQLGHGGKGGYTPFIDRNRDIYGVFVIRENSPGGGAQYVPELTGLTTYVKLYSGLAKDKLDEAEVAP